MHVKTVYFPTYAIFFAINLGYGVCYSKGMENCIFDECVFTGYICKNNKCVCDSDEPTFSRCLPPKSHGELCNSDQECQLSDYNLYCVKSDTRICKCKRNYVWDLDRRKCLSSFGDDLYLRRFDAVRDLIIPVIIVVTVGAMVYLGFKLFCNCGKLWRRRRHQEITRELEEISSTPHQQATWIASYRVFSPYNNTNRPSPGLSPTAFPQFFPPPCMSAFVPGQLSISPPSYEEALKHKVILSSYQPTGAQLPAYTLPATDISRQYQTLPANSSTSSSAFIINANRPATSATRLPPVSGQRSLPTGQTETYATMPITHESVWNQRPYSVSGATGQMLSPQHPSSLPRAGPEVTSNAEAETIPYSRGPEIRQQQNNRAAPQPVSAGQQAETQSRTSTFRPAHPARIFQTSEPSQSLPDTEIPN